MKTLLLYTTSSCHLCEIAHALISPLLAESDLSLCSIEISESDELIERYGVRIPVLKVEGCELELEWPFEQQDFVEFLKKS